MPLPTLRTALADARHHGGDHVPPVVIAPAELAREARRTAEGHRTAAAGYRARTAAGDPDASLWAVFAEYQDHHADALESILD